MNSKLPKPNTTNSELKGYWHKARCPYADYDYSVICDCFLELEALIASKVREARKEERSMAMQYLHDTNRLNDYRRKLALNVE